MSYINMDHAGWVQRQIDATYCGGKPNAAERRAASERKGWWAAPHQLSPFQKRAIDILGIVGNGIYNAPISWKSVIWDDRFISVKWRHSLSTFDFMALTRLVFLCHEARIRADISPAMQMLEITLSPRSHEGSISLRHPNLDEAIATWREAFPSTHSIIYSGPPTTPPPSVAASLSNPGADVSGVSATAPGKSLQHDEDRT